MTSTDIIKIKGVVAQGSVIALLVASVLLFPSSEKAFRYLCSADFSILSQPGSIQQELQNLQTPLCGEEYALPPEVQSMISLLRTSQVEAFRYSPTIADNTLFAQRLTEGAYPLRVSETSHFLVYFLGEPVPGVCKTIAVQEGVAIANCP